MYFCVSDLYTILLIFKYYKLWTVNYQLFSQFPAPHPPHTKAELNTPEYHPPLAELRGVAGQDSTISPSFKT